MTKNLYIIPAMSLELENVKIDKLYKIGNNVIKGEITYNDQKLLIKGPKMILGSPISKNDDYYYIDLTFDKKSNNNKNFMKQVNGIDYFAINDIFENFKQWYHGLDNVSLVRIEQEYIPSVKKSSVYNDRHSLKLKVPCDKIEFYDQDNIALPYQLIKENFPVVPLLNLVAICKDNNHIWSEWALPQLKIDVPDNLLKGCQLVDIGESDSEDETIPDDDFESK